MGSVTNIAEYHDGLILWSACTVLWWSAAITQVFA